MRSRPISITLSKGMPRASEPGPRRRCQKALRPTISSSRTMLPSTLPVATGLEDASQEAAGAVFDPAPDQGAEGLRLLAQFHGNLLTSQRSGSSPWPRPCSSALPRRCTAAPMRSTASQGTRSAFEPQSSGPASRRGYPARPAGQAPGVEGLADQQGGDAGRTARSSMSSTRPQRLPSQSRICSSSRRWAMKIGSWRFIPRPRWSSATAAPRRSRGRRSGRSRTSRAGARRARWRARP